VNNPLSDAIYILKKDRRLLAYLNALYFCVIVVGATLALISPDFHLSMVQYLGYETISGPLGAQQPANAVDALIAAGNRLASIFVVDTVLMITAPSVIMPLWAPIIGAARFFIWGVAYVSPLEGVLTLGDLLPQYVSILLEGEAYIIAIFACVRQIAAAVDGMGFGFSWMIKRYGDAIGENLKLLIIVLLLLAAAALYQAFLIPALSGIL
jgi:hypothetical protein